MMVKSYPAMILKLLGSMGMALTFLGCHAGGNITDSPLAAPSPTGKVEAPTIASPAASPYYSQANSVTLTGMCQSGEEVLLSGDDAQQTVCSNSQYSMQITKTVDGVYSFYLTQKTADQRLSSPVAVVWMRKTSVAPPNILNPSASVFASDKQSLLIEGSCESGALISLTGDGVGYTTCLNSNFSLSLPKSVDGDYVIGVQQTDLAGNTASSSLTWKKHVLTLNPGNASVVVNTSFTFTLSGGSEVYSVTLPQNNSGGALNTSTNTYTSGTLAKVVDVLRVTDSLGSVLDFAMTTVAGAPDHFVLISSDSPTAGLPGNLAAEVVEAKLVDQYGNGIAAYPISFKVTSGDTNILSNALQVTDLNGVAQVSLKHGYRAFQSILSVSPSTGVLPDLAATGNSMLKVAIAMETNNKGKVGATYATGSNPGMMAVGDFNGDGKKDLAVLNIGNNTVGILLGQAGGVFGAMVNYPTNCNGSNAIAVGAVIQSNKQDLVVSCGGDNGLVFMEGLGDGSFGMAQVLPAPMTQGLPIDVKLVDWNGDSKLDIVLVASLGSVIGIWLGNGLGGFTPSIEIPVGTSPNSIEIADLNKDGLKDFVVVNSGDSTLGVIAQISSNVFSAMTTFAVDVGPIQVRLADLDEDTFLDAIVCNNGANNITLWYNDHVGGFQNSSLISVGASPTGIDVSDIDGNNKPDITVVNSGEDSLSIIMNRGGGTLENLPVFSVIAGPFNIIGADFNADGVADLVLNTGNQLVQVLPGNTEGLGYKASTKIGPTLVTHADWNSDGNQDVAVIHTGTNEISLLLGRGNGLFSAGVSLINVIGARGLLGGDWNKDNKMDLAVSVGGTSSVRIFMGKGDGTFETPVDYTVGAGPSKLVVADFNSDGFIDIAVVCQTGNVVSVLLGSGDGTFGSRADAATGSGPSDLGFGDINEDQIVDLVISEESNSNIGILIGKGDGSFQTVVSTTTGGSPIGIEVQDFNNDTHLDVVSLNSADGMVSVFLGLGDGSFQARIDYVCGISPLGLVAGDYDGNGRLDVALTNSSDQKLTILFNSGGGALSNQLVIDVKTSLGGLLVSDFNNDGSLDLLATETNNNQVQLWVGH